MSDKSVAIFNNLVNSKDYDVRKSHNARWIDQKVTPDVLAFISDCVLRFRENGGGDVFTSHDIWDSDYARDLVMQIFKKADPWSSKSSNEYDKFFQQPLKMLAYSGVLQEYTKGRRVYFEISAPDVLELIQYENNSLDFIVVYVTKVLKDSGLYEDFQSFFRYQDKDSYHHVKSAFEDFMHQYTPIKGSYEPKRLFTKVVNPLAFANNCKGTRGGAISDSIIKKYELMYNRDNFRDVKKPKGMTRKEYSAQNPSDTYSCDYARYMSSKAKAFVRTYNEKYNSGLSEISSAEATSSLQIHHMFMVSECPELSYYHENLIALTPNQHMTLAHPNNNTSMTDPRYRCKCLLQKLETIRSDEVRGIFQYDLDKFKEVLSIGFSDDTFIGIQGNDYSAIEDKIRQICRTRYRYIEAQ